MSNRPAAAHTLVARFPGVCAVSGQRFAAGASIVRCPGGYALAGVELPARAPEVEPFAGDRLYRSTDLTPAEERIDRQVRAIMSAYDTYRRATGAQSPQADADFAALPEAGKRRFRALAEIENPYDR
jgi:hypothetical protein